MDLNYFNKKQLGIIDEALYIAEDMTSNYFKFSGSEWKRYPFDIKTLSNLFKEDVRHNTFALLKKYMAVDNEESKKTYREREFYMICLQDHQILKALQRDKELNLLPLLAYILTHELVHIVRFFTFQIRFDTEEPDSRTREERIVYQETHNILKNLSLPNLPYILNSYNPVRMNVDICMV